MWSILLKLIETLVLEDWTTALMKSLLALIILVLPKCFVKKPERGEFLKLKIMILQWTIFLVLLLKLSKAMIAQK